jgi:DNA-binding CsgD family transcriptional regulator
MALAQEAELRRLIERASTMLRDVASDFDQLSESLIRTPGSSREERQSDIAWYSMEYLAERARINDALFDTAAIAVTEIASTHPGPVPPDAVLAEELERTRYARERGVAVRSIYGECYFKSPNGAKHLRSLSAIGARVRLLGSIPLRVILSDDLAMFSEPDDRGLAVLRPAFITRAVHQVLKHWWVTATPLEDLEHRLQEGPTPQEQAILQLMAAGVPDQAIAREIGVSIRTLRRTLAALMHKLGAENRFQAGIKATARGWL